MSYLRILTRYRFSSRNLIRNWMIRSLNYLKISCIFHHVTIPSSMTFWAVSRSSRMTNLFDDFLHLNLKPSLFIKFPSFAVKVLVSLFMNDHFCNSRMFSLSDSFKNIFSSAYFDDRTWIEVGDKLYDRVPRTCRPQKRVDRGLLTRKGL